MHSRFFLYYLDYFAYFCDKISKFDFFFLKKLETNKNFKKKTKYITWNFLAKNNYCKMIFDYSYANVIAN